MNADKIITNLIENLKQRTDTRALIPAGYVPGMPMIEIRNQHSVAIVPLLKYQITGVPDKTLVFPVRFVMEFALPQTNLVGFRDLAYDTRFAGIDFKRPVGLFRHEAVMCYTQEQYRQLRAETMTLMDRLVAALIGESTITVEDNDRLHSNMQKLVEPSVLNTYRILAPEFFGNYIAWT